MYHQFSSMLAVLLLVIAAVTVLIMLEMNSKMDSGEPPDKSAFRNVLGSIFLFLFAGLLAYLMFTAGSFQERLSDSPQLLYLIVGLLLVPLLVIRAVIARRKARISTRLLLFGISLFVLSFGLTGIAAKYYALHGGDLNALLNAADSNIVSVETGQAALSKKCSKCHSLERVYTTNATDWSSTVTKMAGYDPDISESDIKLISEYLTQLRKTVPQRTSVERGRDLVNAKCSKCHSLDKVFSANMTPERWAETVDDMVKIIGLPDFISKQEKDDIVSFLADRRREQRDMWSSAVTTVEGMSDEKMNQIRRLVARKCSAGCHALDRVLRGRAEKSREQWSDTINSMIEITGDPDFLSEQERKDILDYLSRPLTEEDAQTQPSSSGISHSPTASGPRKCATCHSLERVLQAVKSREEWEETINSMIEITGDPDFLSEQEKEEILDHFSRSATKKDAPQASGIAHPLVSKKCGACHNLERVQKATKSKEEWTETVKNMAAHADKNGAGDFLSQKDQEDIVTIISSWEVQK